MPVGPGGREKAELAADILERRCRDCGERGVEGLGIEAPGDGDVIEVAGNEDVIVGQAVGEFLGQDLGIAFEGHARTAHDVSGDGLVSEGRGREDGDLAVRECDDGIAMANSEVLDGPGVPFDVGGELMDIPI